MTYSNIKMYRGILLCICLFSISFTTLGVENEAYTLIGRMAQDRVVITSLDEPENVILELENVTLFDGNPELEWLLHPHEIKLSPDKQQIAFVTVQPDIYNLNIITLSTLSKRTIPLPYPATAEWSPNGDAIFISLFRTLYIDRVYQYEDSVTGFIYNLEIDELIEVPVTGISHIQGSDENDAFLIGRDSNSGQALYKVSSRGEDFVKLTDFANVSLFPDRTVTRICPPMVIDTDANLVYFTERCETLSPSSSNLLSLSMPDMTVRYETDLSEFEAEEITGVDAVRPLTMTMIDEDIYVVTNANIWSRGGRLDGWRVLKLTADQDVRVLFETERVNWNPIHHATFSPDGQYVALSAQSTIAVVNLDTGNMWEATLTEEVDEWVCSFHWISDSELMFDASGLCATHAAGAVNSIPGRIYKFDVITESLVMLVESDAWLLQ